MKCAEEQIKSSLGMLAEYKRHFFKIEKIYQGDIWWCFPVVQFSLDEIFQDDSGSSSWIRYTSENNKNLRNFKVSSATELFR